MTIDFKHYIEDVPDFPKPGILFRDISPLLAHQFPAAIDAMSQLYDQVFWSRIDAIAGVDARGFIFAAALADRLEKELVLVRKAGKLPPPVITHTYELEYGRDRLEMKAGSGRVIIVDDVLATGGTLHAAAELCAQAGYDVQGFLIAINLRFLNDFTWHSLSANALVTYDE